MRIMRIKVPKWIWARVYGLAYTALMFIYPDCPTKLRVDGKLYRVPPANAWKIDGNLIVCDLEPFEEQPQPPQ
jgi:hypothetical protein